MTKFSDVAPVVQTLESAGNGDGPGIRPARAGPISQDAAGVVDAVLDGGPVTLPDGLRTHCVASTDHKIKILHYGGYEHFERDDSYAADGIPAVFRWTGRTEIAE